LPTDSASQPHVTDHEDAAAVLPNDGGLHVNSLQHGRGLAVDVDIALFDLPSVNDVVGEHSHPLLASHDRWRWMHQDEGKVGVHYGISRYRITLGTASSKRIAGTFEAIVGHGIEDDTD